MPHTTSSLLLPGVYPEIKSLKPKIGGNNNLGVGVDTVGKEYVLKLEELGTAEFVGAALCASMKIPHCTPTIVCLTDVFGNKRHLFGSAVESGLLRFNMRDISEWSAVVAELSDVEMFTVMLALDLCLGNDDRHSENWLVKGKDAANHRPKHELLAMDFSNSWPTFHPPHHPRIHPSPNTWNLTRHWPLIGIPFDEHGFKAACAKIALLDQTWLKTVLDPMVGIWITAVRADELCVWWQDNWRSQVTEVIYSLEPDGEWL